MSEPTITDEELAEMDRRFRNDHLHKSINRAALVGLILGLIAALRAERAELAIVRKLANDSVLTLDAENEQLRAELRDERLRAEQP